MFGYNQPSKVTVVFRYISVVRSSGIHYRPTYHGQIASGTLGDYHSLWSTISWRFFPCCPVVGKLVHLNTGAAYHLCHSRGKFVAKNLTFLPCIGLNESRMRGVVYVLGI
ncbi:hypothetical protein NC651_005245 [Populus alba x Populus x berolinensis]|nr:hypothetical protein NC651_005245 [Populus alba x Populus x berolinensis]